MIATPHALFGAAVGVGSGRFLLAAVLSYCGHIVLDALPSWEPLLFGGQIDMILIGLDVTVAGTLLYIVLRRFSFKVAIIALWGAGFSVLPDVFVVVSLLTGSAFPFPLSDLHQAVQYEHMPVLGTLSQLIVIGLSLWFLKRKQARVAAEKTNSKPRKAEIEAL